MISVQSQIEIAGDLNLASISQKIDEVNIPKEILTSVLVKLQNEIVLDLCGPSTSEVKIGSSKEQEQPIEHLEHGMARLALGLLKCTQKNPAVL